MSIERKPLSASEEAFVAMILEEHKELIRQADARRDARMKPLLADQHIPEGVPVKIEKPNPDQPAALVFETPTAVQPLKAKRRS